MATTSVRLPHAPRFSAWFSDFLRKELAPYPGRVAMVARMVISATLCAILVITFRIPGGVVGALCAFILSRENLLATAKSALNFIIVFLIGGLFIPIGARFFASDPMTHFFWEGVSIFGVFFLLRTLANYAIAAGLSIVTINILAIWYLPGPAQKNVELTLWQVASALIGAVVTLGVEVVFYAIHHRDELSDGLDVRLGQIENLMSGYAAGTSVSPETERLLAQYAVVGVGALRRYVARANYQQLHRLRMSTLTSLVGRSVDFAAALSSTVPSFPPVLQQRAARLAQYIAEIRHSLYTDGIPATWTYEKEGGAAQPLLSAIESMVSLMPTVFESEASIDPLLDVLENPRKSNRLFVADAFSNPEHLRFVLSGTLAAMICYILYVSLAWPGISTSVTTCVLTGLSNVGASRQKQVLRVAGALLGGFVFGMGAQIFVLPNIDSIAGFAVLFASVTTVAAWLSTSSSRLSYAGLQIAVAFYLINLSEFSIQTSLILARDRAIGVLLGIFMMWLVFERFFPRPAADEMVRIFIRNLRLMAELITASPAGTDKEAIVKIRKQRDQVFRNFSDVSAQADAVPFETGPRRGASIAASDHIRRWQASLRTFYLLETPLIQFRVFGDAGQRSKRFAEIEDAFRDECSRSFLRMADALENQLYKKPYDNSAPRSLVALLDTSPIDEVMFSGREVVLLGMTRTIASLTDRMQNEIVSQPLYASE